MRRKLLTSSVLALALTAPAAAAGDGLPAGTNADAGGISAPGLNSNYVVVPAGNGTVLGRVDKRTGRLAASRYLRTPLAMPAVALDGTPGGLSAGGGTLVLIRPRTAFPQRSTQLAVFDGRTLRIRKRVRLRGDFSFDAIAPDGGTLYLIEYRSSTDTSQYAVRAYDLRRDRLLARPIVDPREPDEKMTGFPVTRATSAHGRWAYTLYDGTEHPFVHALDTVRNTAFCVDLDLLAKDDLYRMSLDLAGDGRTLTVRRSGVARAEIDTRSFRVSAPGGESDQAAGDDGAPWAALGGAAAALLAAAGALVLRRRRVPARA